MKPAFFSITKNTYKIGENTLNTKKLRVLSIGNSFSTDTMEHLAKVARNFGCEDIALGNLYIGGCSISMHHRNLIENIGAYKFYTNYGDGWSETPDHNIKDAIKKENWDFISIQHGSKNGSRYSDPECYSLLPDLTQAVRELAPSSAKILFNLAWVAEPYSNRAEITEWNGNKELLFEKMCEITSEIVERSCGIDFVSPTGTAIMNACESEIRDSLYRDGFHLSYGIGRFIAALTFYAKITGESIDKSPISFDGATDTELKVAISSVKNALKYPYKITKAIKGE